jgi:hypothetical protein
MRRRAKIDATAQREVDSNEMAQVMNQTVSVTYNKQIESVKSVVLGLAK